MLSLTYRTDDLTDPAVRDLVGRHLEGMHESTPAENVFALGLDALSGPGLAFWSGWDGDSLAVIGCLRAIDAENGEIKSMRVADAHLGRGAGRAMLRKIIAEAESRGMRRLWLETGRDASFEPALRLYRSEGFEETGPFGGYPESEFSLFMSRTLDHSVRYVAIGDSFTEGVGDEVLPGTPRGWADLVAQGWADLSDAPIGYANLAIRGRLAWPIIEEQLEPALALKPTHLSFNGGGNDMLRPKTPLAHIADTFSHVLRRCDEEGVQLIMLSGADPSGQLPLGRMIQRRGDLLSDAVLDRVTDRPDVIRALNWPDKELATPPYWSADRLHMNARGHHRVAARVLTALGFEPPAEWWSLPAADAVPRARQIAYYREHVAPWLRRRMTGTSSGDGRAPKFGTFTTIVPAER